jgi:hypothetical protein
MKKIFSKHVVEIRYKPNPRFLDKRGEIAESLSGSFFDQWNISNNRIDFSSKTNENITAFISFRNLGIFTNHPNTVDFFKEKAKDFIKSAWTNFPTSKITRIGIRSIYLIETSSFKNSFDEYRKKFLGLSDDDLKKFNGDLIDLGFPLNFSVGEDFFNVTTGPMEKIQSKEFLLDDDELPEAGIFVDVDYFKKEFSPHIIQKNVLGFIDTGSDKAENIKDLIAGWTVKDK